MTLGDQRPVYATAHGTAVLHDQGSLGAYQLKRAGQDVLRWGARW